MKSTLRTLLYLMLLLLTANTSWAEQGFRGNLTLGGDLTWLTNESYKYGEYDGLHEDSKHTVSDVELSYERASYYTEIKALDMGYHDETVMLEGGSYGRYSLQLGYTKLIHFISEGETPLSGIEEGDLVLPGGFGQHTTTSSMVSGSSIPSYGVDLDTKRKDDFIRYEQNLTEKVSFSLDYRHGEKEGIISRGGVTGADGTLSASIILPERVDYVTDSFNAGVSYESEKGRLELEYRLSRFHNRHDSISWDNPFAAPSGDAYPDRAQISLPPDNKNQSLSLTATATVTEKVWLSFMAGYDRMEQDEALLPYTINTSSSVPLSVPRDSAEANINVSHLSLNVTSTLTPSLYLVGDYVHFESKNETPKDLFLKVPNDTGDQVVATDKRALYNLPRDRRKDKIGIDARYRLGGGTRVNLGVDYEVIKRNYRAVKGTNEITLNAGVSRRLAREGSIKLDFSYADRQIDGDYDRSRLYNAYHSSASGFYNYTAGIFDENEDLRQYDIADRLKGSYAIRFSQRAFSRTVLGLSCRYMDEYYGHSTLGLKERQDKSCTIDMTATASKNTNLYVFYTHDRVDTDLANRSFSAGIYSEAIDKRRTWWTDSRDLNHTVGLGTTIAFMDGDLVFDADYLYSISRTSINFRVQPDSTIGFPDSLPDLKIRRDAFNLSGRYRFDKKVSFGTEYYFEKYQSSDWATDNIDPASPIVDELLTLTGSYGPYEVHGIRFYLIYRL